TAPGNDDARRWPGPAPPATRRRRVAGHRDARVSAWDRPGSPAIRPACPRHPSAWMAGAPAGGRPGSRDGVSLSAGQRLGHLAAAGAAEQGGQPATGVDQAIEVDAGFDAEAVEHVRDVLAGDVAAGAG